MTDTKREGSAAAGGSASPVGKPQTGWIALLASVRLTLWLLAILIVAIAIATFIPQNEPEEAYLHAFGTALGPLVAKTALRNIYGAWWFVLAFGLLAINLLACSLQRTQQLLRNGREAPTEKITRSQVLARTHQLRWRTGEGVERTAEALRASLQRRGWAVSAAPGENGSRGLVARRGRIAPWAPAIIHVGVVIVLLGAAWGRFPGVPRLGIPGNVYRAMAPLKQGGTFVVPLGSDSFTLRLLDAGTGRGAKGQVTNYWADVEVLQENQVIRSAKIESNRPLRYHGVAATLNSMSDAGRAIEVRKGDSVGHVPVAVGPDGQVDMMATVTLLDDPHWIVFVHELGQDAQGRPQAKVFIDKSGQVSHNWQTIGWVGESGLDYEGVHFALAQAGPSVVLSLDRDIGIPIVYLGFIIVALGAVLVLGSSRHSLVALVAGRGQGSQVFVGVSRSRSGAGVEKLLKPVQSDLGAVREAGSSQESEEAE